MNQTDPTNWKVPKLPFWIFDALLIAFACFIVWRAPHPLTLREAIVCIVVCVAGAGVGIIPYILDYRAMGRIIEVNALGAVVDQIQNLDKISSQITSATNHWAGVQGIVQAGSDKTVAAAKGIADKMAVEVKEFSAFMQNMNDSEKATLRLEVDKLRRAEGEWLQVLIRIMDHVYSLHVAAVRSGEAKFAEPITQFQEACRGATRRLGLTPYAAETGEPFDAERHQTAGNQEPVPPGAVVSETLATGYTFQGKRLRPALVRVGELKTEAPAPAASTGLPAGKNDEDQLTLESPD